MSGKTVECPAKNDWIVTQEDPSYIDVVPPDTTTPHHVPTIGTQGFDAIVDNIHNCPYLEKCQRNLQACIVLKTISS